MTAFGDRPEAEQTGSADWLDVGVQGEVSAEGGVTPGILA